ncbi:MAG: HEAT repeat domain-containing protein [Vicinamibacterales bacterium]
MTRTSIALVFALATCACASAPPAPAGPPEPTFDQKLSWMLRLEDTRTLRDPAPPAPEPPPAPSRGRAARVVVPAAPPAPDLVRLLGDREARVRRRAALAIGRVGLPEAVDPLLKVLADPDPEVRQMAAFALGMLGDVRAKEPLVAALADSAPVVRGSAAEALGKIGDRSAADAIGKMAAAIVGTGALSQTPPGDLEAARDTPSAAFRLAVQALARLNAYDALAAAALDASGQPRVRWWPVAAALAQVEDPRALPALLTLLGDAHPYTRAFAAKGLGAMKGDAAAAPLVPLVAGEDRALAIEAIRSLARLRALSAAPAVLKLVQAPKTEPHVRLEAVLALGSLPADGVYDTLLDVLGDPSPSIRAAALRSLAQFDGEGFITVLSGLDPDRDWHVRAALATVLGELAPDAGLPRLRAMLADAEPRVLPAVIAAVAKLRPADVGTILAEQMKANDPVVRAAAARAIGDLRLPSGPALLPDAYQRSLGDATYVARAAVLAALRVFGADVATPLLTDALADKDWAVRVRAAELLRELDPSSDARARIRPAPSARAGGDYQVPWLTNPPVSTQVFIDTDRGSIQLEMAVLDAPLTVQNFVTLARNGFFDGLLVHRVVPTFVAQSGDPRGDGEGGPGYTIRDEINERPYLRGTVGMALDWKDTGGSQFFITLSPQPQLDGRYTAFARVVDGMDVVDALEQGDVVRRVRIWDGTTTR